VYPVDDHDSGLLKIFAALVYSNVFYQQPGMSDVGSEISDLTSMGFSVEVARHALMRYGNNSERALDWLLNVGEEAAAAAAGVAYHDATASSAYRGGAFPPKTITFSIFIYAVFYGPFRSCSRRRLRRMRNSLKSSDSNGHSG
jgi:hypothetical protein